MVEEQLINVAKEVSKRIKIALIEKGLSQVDLARILDVGTPQLNRAIKGNLSPKSIEIRKRIYHLLDIK